MKLKEIAHNNRRNMTKAEQALWSVICKAISRKWRNRTVKPQMILGQMIVDFWFKKKALVVEIDGLEHDPIKDSKRDAYLARFGLKTLRFTNAVVLADPQTVLDQILSYPDQFGTHSKAVGRIWKLTRDNKYKALGQLRFDPSIQYQKAMQAIG